MTHRLIDHVEKALGWAGPERLGRDFAVGGGAGTDLVERLLTPSRLLDLVMRRSLADPQLRCFRDGTELHPNAYVTRGVTRRGQSIGMVDMRRLAGLLDGGATLVVDQVNVFDPTLEAACRALQWWSRERVQANVYLTTNDATGFDLHWDDHDVLIVQLAGEKRWEVRGGSRRAPMYRDAARNSTPGADVVWTGVLRPGEVMHIPRGSWHKATRKGLGTGLSMHVTFGLVQRTGVHWMSWLADWSRDTDLFREDLQRWADPREREHQCRRLGDEAAALIRSRGPAAYLTAHEQETGASRHVRHLAVLGPLRSVVCVTDFPPRIESHENTVEVLAAGKRLTFAHEALPSLRLLLGGDPVPLADAVAVAGSASERVAEILVEEELCAWLTPELSSGYTDLVTAATP
ncbi:cupin domain-containing protein [Actinocorallia sp. API 0066]|uniref:cupin domain-containing protein n=1 Tax=Actinocorallia sp. API 0066 TaxID=2896846 RepID=UPI001E58EFD4|nr:cupin domain-containing protein [Actinocorallia sp. API 0066]MCD0450895.1 cupin domain-containing protein [Actinocorallia sp. API 0066]